MSGEHPLPGSAPLRLISSGAELLRPDEQVWTEMLEGWKSALMARTLGETTIYGNLRVLQDFRSVTGDYPWMWMPQDVDEYITTLHARNGGTAAKSTIRAYLMVVSGFCSFLCEPAYRWPELCSEVFGEYPSQICFAYNLPVHVSDNEAEPQRRAFSCKEIQTLFDFFDDEVERLYAPNSKAWLTTLRDSCIVKTAYAYGLRRQELLRLQIHDFGPNSHVPQYKSYGAVYVRFGKGSRGSAHKRRPAESPATNDPGATRFRRCLLRRKHSHMNVQKRVDFHWNLRKLMAERNLWKSTELVTLLRSRGITLSQPQAYRLMTGKPERINSRVFAALCDILDCSPAELFEPVVVMQARATGTAPDILPAGDARPKNAPGVRRVRVVDSDDSAPRDN